MLIAIAATAVVGARRTGALVATAVSPGFDA